MTRTVHRPSIWRLFVGLVAAVMLVSTVALHAQSATDRQTANRVMTMLERLPYYGVFDFLTVDVERGIVTVKGYAYNGKLKTDAADAVKRAEGVNEFSNQIEILPASQNDDRIRWATFYKIYGDDFLSRYAPGGQTNARREALQLRRFPGMQPVGAYPIHIVVKHGRTTLVGIVDNESDRLVAELKAKEVPGVFGLQNQLMVSED
jgi:osmotically-inducible protein OsmY